MAQVLPPKSVAPLKFCYAQDGYDGILCKCPRCGKSLKVHDNDLGQILRCGECGSEFAAPALSRPELRRALLRSRPKMLVTALALVALSALFAFVEGVKGLSYPSRASTEAVAAGFALFAAISTAIVVAIMWLIAHGYNWARIVVIVIQCLYGVDDLFGESKPNTASFVFRCGVVLCLCDPRVLGWFRAAKRLRKS
jgi:uncharacterized membrane protein YhaH (DUF805 family)